MVSFLGKKKWATHTIQKIPYSVAAALTALKKNGTSVQLFLISIAFYLFSTLPLTYQTYAVRNSKSHFQQNILNSCELYSGESPSHAFL